jgi:hypothetical protein
MFQGKKFTKEHIYKIYKKKLGEVTEESLLLESSSRLTAK